MIYHAVNNLDLLLLSTYATDTHTDTLTDNIKTINQTIIDGVYKIEITWVPTNDVADHNQ